MRSIQALCAAALFVGGVGFAQAQEVTNEQANPDLVETNKLKEALAEAGEAKKRDGWQLGLELAANFAFGHSSNVVGNPDGSTIQVGGMFGAHANYRSGGHEWSNVLGITHTQAMTPQIDQFVKTVDNAELRSTYLYSIASVPWLGPFARVRAQTQILPGYAIYAEDQILSVDGGVEQRLFGQDTFDLTKAFEPLTLRESAGFFARPVEDESFTAIITLGVGAQEIFTRGGRVITDDADTPDVIEITSLEDSVQVGGELEFDLKGTYNKFISWTLQANLFYPFVTETKLDTELEGVDLMNVEFAGKLSVKLADWASLDYVLSAKRIPLVIDAWQMQNGLLLTTSFKLL